MPLMQFNAVLLRRTRTEKRKVDSSILSLTTVVMQLDQPSGLREQQEERDRHGAEGASY